MKDKKGIIWKDGKSTEEILKNLSISRLTENDIEQVGEISAACLPVSDAHEAIEQFYMTHGNIRQSIKAYDRTTGQIYGILLLSDYPICCGSPILDFKPELGKQLMHKRGINGFSFVIDGRLRGTDAHRRMLNSALPFVSQFEYIWCAVADELKTHNYWKRLGFKEILVIPEAKFYILNTTDL